MGTITVYIKTSTIPFITSKTITNSAVVSIVVVVVFSAGLLDIPCELLIHYGFILPININTYLVSNYNGCR